VLLLCRFFFSFYFLFGYFSVSYSSIGSSALTLFKGLLGKVDYSTMHDSNSEVSVYVFFLFSLVFYFIILNLFLSIILSHYEYVRKKTQLKTEANANIAAEEGQKWTQNALNLLLCVEPGKAKEEKKEEKSIFAFIFRRKRRGLNRSEAIQ
jgi:hypothetical protein